MQKLKQYTVKYWPRCGFAKGSISSKLRVCYKRAKVPSFWPRGYFMECFSSGQEQIWGSWGGDDGHNSNKVLFTSVVFNPLIMSSLALKLLCSELLTNIYYFIKKIF